MFLRFSCKRVKKVLDIIGTIKKKTLLGGRREIRHKNRPACPMLIHRFSWYLNPLSNWINLLLPFDFFCKADCRYWLKLHFILKVISGNMPPPQKWLFSPIVNIMHGTFLIFFPVNLVYFYTKNSQKVNFLSNCVNNTGLCFWFFALKVNFPLNYAYNTGYYFDFCAR